MSLRSSQSGFSLVELLVSLSLLVVGVGALSGLLLENARANRSQQLAIAAQSNARNCLSIVVPVLRTAGWDPLNTGLAAVILDGSGNGNWIRAFADLNEDGDTADEGEDVTIRFRDGRLEWRTTSDSSRPFQILSEDISNDADGNGTPEAMFVPDSVTDPTRITVRLTARSSVADPRSRKIFRYTASTEVLLRERL